MSLVGADVAAIRTFVQRLNQRSAAIAQTTTQLTGVIEGLPWIGTDRERFLTDWKVNHHPGLLQLLADLAEAATTAGKAADAQEAASSARDGEHSGSGFDGYSGGGGGGGGGGWG